MYRIHLLRMAHFNLFPLDALGSNLFSIRWSNVSGTKLPTGRHHLLTNHSGPEAVEADTTVQLLEYAVLPIRTGLRQI